MNAVRPLGLFDVPPVALPVPAAHAAPIARLIARVQQGRTVLVLEAQEAVDATWLTVERIACHAHRAAPNPVDVEIWPLLARTWILALHTPYPADHPTTALLVQALRERLAATLDAEWRAEPNPPAPFPTRSLHSQGKGESNADSDSPFPCREGVGGRSLFSPFPVPVPIISGSEANEVGKGAGGLGLTLVTTEESVFALTPVAQIADLQGQQQRLAELNALMEILIHQQLEVQFQPIVSLRDGQVLGYEALVRGPKGAPLRRPGQMFRTADKARMVAWFDLACLRACFARAGELRLKPLLFVNMDAEGLASIELMETALEACAQENGLRPENIVIEITERQTADDFPALLHSIQKLREQGFKVAVDDAGAGYSSLNAIAELRPEFIKTDHALIRNVDANGVKRAMLAAFVQYARHIGTAILAEGVETREELATLIDLGVTFGQGYVLGRPADDFRGIPRETREFMRLRAKQTLLATMGRQANILGLAKAGVALPPETPIAEAARRFVRDLGLTSVVVVEEGCVRGVVMREQLAHALGVKDATERASLLPEETVGQWMRTNILCVSEESPVCEVARQATTRQDISLDADIVIQSRDGAYRGVISVRALMEAATATQESRDRYANPLTGLPGRVVLEQELQERLTARSSLAVIRTDIARLEAFNRQYGVANGDSLIRAVAHLLREVSARHGRPNDFLAHLGGDDFVLLTEAEAVWDIARALTAGFDALVPQHYTAEHVRQGGVDLEDRAGVRQRVPLCALAVAAQTNRKHRLSHYAQIMASLDSMLRYAKAFPASHYAVDRTPEKDI